MKRSGFVREHQQTDEELKIQRARIEIAGKYPVIFANDVPLVFLAGPCVIEGRTHALEVAHALSEIRRTFNVGFVYKSSFDKANRTSIKGKRGVGLKKGLAVLAEVKEKYQIPLVTDIHLPEQCGPVSEVVDILQIPAFLCRQTDLLVSAAQTGRIINVKKGQFMAPWDMQHVVEKIESAGGQQIMLCERGVSFGYNTLVNDMRALPIMKKMHCPVIFDATHSVQKPAGAGHASSGERCFIEPLARAAVAIGIAGVFVETHPDPDHAPSDGPNMVPLKELPKLINTLLAIDRVVK